MAFKILVMCVMIFAAVNANFVWPDNSFFINIPKPTFPNIEFPKLKTVDEIMRESENNPNANYNAVIVSSNSKSSVGPDGKVQKSGGTTVISNNNGERHEIKFGDHPPVVKTTSSTPSSNNANKDTKTDNTVYNDFTIPQINVPQITLPQIALPQVPVWQPVDQMKSIMDTVNSNLNSVSQSVIANSNSLGNYQTVISNPGGYQTIYSSSTGPGGYSGSSSFSSSISSVNGVSTGGGIASTSYNVNGDSGGNTIIYTTK